MYTYYRTQSCQCCPRLLETRSSNNDLALFLGYWAQLPEGSQLWGRDGGRLTSVREIHPVRDETRLIRVWRSVWRRHRR